ncbi:hypothetical protein JW859_11260 [bacterium]|nr:hypothetical protein [bacterium]
MSKRNPWSAYLKHAFQNWYNYIAMGLAVGLALILKQEGIIYIGTAAELLYLYMCVSNPRYQRYVDSLLNEEDELDIEPLRLQLWPLINSELKLRYGKLAALTQKLDQKDVSAVIKRDPFFRENQRKIAVLLANYLKITVAVTRYQTYLADVDPTEIEENIARLEKEIPEAAERIQAIKQKNIEILQKRMEKLVKAKANCEYLLAQMETIEDTMKLVIDQAITLSDPKGMGVQIDTLLMNLQETELVAAEMETFSELEEGLSDEIFPLERE